MGHSDNTLIYLACTYFCTTVRQYVQRKMVNVHQAEQEGTDRVRKKLKKGIQLDSLDSYQFQGQRNGFNLRNRVKINLKEDTVPLSLYSRTPRKTA